MEAFFLSILHSVMSSKNLRNSGKILEENVMVAGLKVEWTGKQKQTKFFLQLTLIILKNRNLPMLKLKHVSEISSDKSKIFVSIKERNKLSMQNGKTNVYSFHEKDLYTLLQDISNCNFIWISK